MDAIINQLTAICGISEVNARTLPFQIPAWNDARREGHRNADAILYLLNQAQQIINNNIQALSSTRDYGIEDC